MDESEGVLRRDGKIEPIDRRPFELLRCLARNANRILSKQELFASVWGVQVVSDQALSSALRDVRRALGDVDNENRMIETARGRGYRLALPVHTREPEVRRAIAPSPRSAPPGELADREEALAQLRKTHQAALAGETGLSLLLGPPGIGKTRLAEQLLYETAMTGAEPLFARCSASEGTAPLWPFVQVVRACIRRRGLGVVRTYSAGDGDPIGALTPELGRPPESIGDDEIGRAEARFRLFDAVASFLRAACVAQPLLILVDDLQWADQASLLLLEFLVENVTDAHLHLVVTARSGESGRGGHLERLLGRFARAPRADHIELGGLQRATVARLVETAIGVSPPRNIVDSVCAATGGNPFFVTEVARLMADNREAESAQAESWSIPVPPRVRDAVRLHLQARTPACISLLELASVIGREFDSTLLANAAAMPRHQVLELLDEAERTSLVRSVHGAPGQFVFIHDVTRETLYSELGAQDKARLHGAVANTLELAARADPVAYIEPLAFHHDKAGDAVDPRKALHYAVRAAERARDLMAYEDSVAYYGHALRAQQLDPNADARERCELMVAQAEAMWSTHVDSDVVRAHFDRAAELALALNEGELLGRAALGRAGHGAIAGMVLDFVQERDVTVLEQARTLLAGTRTATHALVLVRLAWSAWYHYGFAASNALSSRAEDLARELGDPETLAQLLRYRHEVLWGPDHVQRRFEIANEIVELGVQLNSKMLEIDGLYHRARDRFEMSDLLGARTDSQRALELSRSLRHPGALFRDGISEVLRLTTEGKFSEARERIEEYFLRDQARNFDARGTRSIQHEMIHLLEGRYQEALAEALRDDEYERRTRWKPCITARLKALAGEYEQAHELLDQLAIDDFASLPGDHSHTACLSNLAEAAMLLGDSQRARSLYEKLRPYEGQLMVPFLSTLCDGPVSRTLGALAGFLGDFEAAQRHFGQTFEYPSWPFSPPLHVLSITEYGRMLLRRNRAHDVLEARKLFADAREIAERIGMRGILERLTTLEAGVALHLV